MIYFIEWSPDPVLFELGIVTLRWYGMLFALGFVVSYQILSYYFKAEQLSIALLDKLTVYVALATLIGARLGHCLFYDFDYYSQHVLEIILPVKFDPQFEFIGYQGLASHGGAFGILVAISIFCYRTKVSFFKILDMLALVIPIAGCCIRLGNLMNSEIIGKPSTVPWTFVFEKVDALPRHPAQLYEAFAYLAIFIIVNVLHQRIRKQPGFIFGLFLALLFLSRFILEFFKENQVDFESKLVLNIGQLLSIPFILFGAVLIVVKFKNKNYPV